MKLRQAIEDYILDCKAGALSPRTIQLYEYILLKRWLPSFPNQEIALEHVERRHIRAYLVKMQEAGNSPYTIDQHRRTINTFFNWCVKQGYLDSNPMALVRKPTLPKKRVPRLSLEQFRRLLELVKTETGHPVRNYAIVLLLGDSGLRLGEVERLNIEDVHLDELYVRVLGKGNKERLVPISQHTARAIRKWLEIRPECDSEALFVVEHQGAYKRISGNTIRLMLHRLRDKLGVPKLSPHLLRHTFANIFLRENGDLRALQEILGHADVNTTAMIYTEPDIEDLKAKHRCFSPANRLLGEL